MAGEPVRMRAVKWRDARTLLAIHGALAAEHGFREDVAHRLEAALESPRAKILAGEADPARLAASYAAAIAVRRPFRSLNEATALAAAYVFLRLNDRRLTAPQREAVAVLEDVARCKLTEPELAAWLAAHTEAAL